MIFNAYSLLIDFCIMSVLLFISQLIRSKVKFIQNLYIPASLIAGTLGLILGPQFLNVIPWSVEAGSYPYLLVCVLFACIFLGKKISNKDKKIGFFKKVGDTFCVNTGCEILCFGIALLIGGGIIVLFLPDVFPEISLLLPSGFAGGHGYAAAIGGSLNELLKRDDAIYIGQFFATIGLLVGLIGGIICINIAARKGYTRFVKKAVHLPLEYRTGFVDKEEGISIGNKTTNSMAIDPLAWHISLILVATGIGYGFKQLLDLLLPTLNFPLMCLTMLSGLLLQLIISFFKIDKYVDKRIIDRCSGSMTDFLVAFGIATIKISTVVTYWVPVLILCIIGIIWPLVIVFVIGKKLFHNFWFERSIFIFGYLTGIVAVGMTLLRCCDPDNKSETLDDFGYAYSLQSVIEVFFVALIPIVTVSLGVVIAGIIVSIIGSLFLILSALLFGVHKENGKEIRTGELEKIS